MAVNYKVVNLHPTEQWPSLDQARREIQTQLGLPKFSLSDTIMYLLKAYNESKDAG